VLYSLNIYSVASSVLRAELFFYLSVCGLQDEQPGEFAKASEEVLQKRRIIKARRAGGGVASTQPAAAIANGAVQSEAPAAAPVSSNPFAGVSLLAKQPQVLPAALSGMCRPRMMWCARCRRSRDQSRGMHTADAIIRNSLA
jgi:NUP50 (Nucleoporin 50 kDa)